MRTEAAEANRREKNWLPGLDSNQDKQGQNLLCCRLHHRAPKKEAVSQKTRVRYPGLCEKQPDSNHL